MDIRKSELIFKVSCYAIIGGTEGLKDQKKKSQNSLDIIEKVRAGRKQLGWNYKVGRVDVHGRWLALHFCCLCESTGEYPVAQQSQKLMKRAGHGTN